MKVKAWVLQWDFGLHIRVGARGDGLGLAALALQFLLRPPGGARRALRAGVGGGAEHLFKAASARVRPAYFRLMSPNFLLMAVPTLLKAAVAFCPA